MAVGELSSDDEPDRVVATAGLAPPCPDRRVLGAIGHDDRPGVADSSGDEKDEITEEVNQGVEGGIEPDVTDPKKTHGGSRSQSRRGSSFANSGIVPRSQRRGLLGRLGLIPEVGRPYEYKNSTKWMITAVVALAAAGAPMGSGIFLPALPSMSVDLKASRTITNLTISFYMLAMSIFPLWWHVPLSPSCVTLSSFSETLGRRTIYIVSFTLFVVFSILNAVSVNISMLVVMRILGGGASASVQAVGAGTIADIWEPAHRGRAMGIFYLGPLVGPLCAPIIGGALAQGFSWRATMWFLSIYGGVMLLMLLLCLPETLARPPPPPPTVPAAESANTLQRVSTTQSIKHHTVNTAALVKRYLIDPLSVVLYLRQPPVFITVYCASIAFFALFVLNISIQSTFSSPPYSFPPIPLGACYLAPSLGYILASLVGGRWIDYIMAREAERAERFDEHGQLVYLPEDRMRENMWLAATLYPGALVWFGWTAQKGAHFMVPSVANFWFGVGSMLVFGVTTTMLTEFMPRRSSSGVAVNNFVRNIFSCVGSVIAQPLIEVMGVGWLCTMVGLFALVTGVAAVWALRRYGATWREEMDRKVNQDE
ncbi:MFS general substrate transporter [Parathielavia appendiculata]|uniref:MFS general substrate transporter n=1 Tax=Parathielavia appendiculata TaxID=2587402 RepID=A0AAN6TVT0_9PEZI|nr:MFS general substrate transporter [Parathielavia appendiculata]